MKNFKGVGVALVTPFKADGAVDFEALTALINHTEPVDYYVVMGTTAESATLSAGEKYDVLHHIIAQNNGRKPIVYGIGGNDTAEVVRQIQETDLEGVDAILSVVPYYNKPSQEGIYRHYAEILTASPLPVILYNVPGRTGVNMTATTTLRLARDFAGKAIAVKEASGNASQAAYILRDRPEGFLVISGDDNLTLPIIALGGDGVISVSANAFARTMTQMVTYALAGNISEASKVNLRLLEVTDLLFAEGNPAGVKAALVIKGVMGKTLRLPLVSASDKLMCDIKTQIEQYGL